MSQVRNEGVDYTRCRTIGHAWFDADSDWKSDLGTPVTLRCERCSMERREVWGRGNGRLMYRTYVRPRDYLYRRGETPTKDDFRLMLLSLRLKEARMNRKPSQPNQPSSSGGGAALKAVR